MGRSIEWNSEIRNVEWICPSSKQKGIRYKYWKHLHLAWEVIAYAVFDSIALMEATHWCEKLFLRCHTIEQLRTMDSNTSVWGMIKMMQQQHGFDNQAIDKHNEKMDGMNQSIRTGKEKD